MPKYCYFIYLFISNCEKQVINTEEGEIIYLLQYGFFIFWFKYEVYFGPIRGVYNPTLEEDGELVIPFLHHVPQTPKPSIIILFSQPAKFLLALQHQTQIASFLWSFP